jgi:hypothetical protein
MRFWKPISLTFLLFAAIVFVTVHSSCEKSTCNGIICYNGGSCGYGLCHCPTGYEGAQCQSWATSRYIGVFGGYTTCNNGAYTIDTAFITQGNRGILSVDVRLKSIAPKWLYGYVSSNQSTYSIIVTDNDSAKAGSLFYLKTYTITLQSDRNLSIHTYERDSTGVGTTITNVCSFLGYRDSL